MAHRTTWICPECVQDHKDKDGNIRRNPYRNQIDYIITRTQYKALVTDSRSYAGFETSTDHRLVKASFKLEWYKMKPKKRHPRTVKHHTTTKPCSKISISSISDKEDENCRGNR